MGKKIRLTESQMKSVVTQRMLNEYGRKGAWKPEWNEQDQILAMFNSMYGLETLGMSKQDVAEQIIGTSLASLNQQTSNFDYLRTGAGLDRPNEMQTKVFEQYKDLKVNEFKKLAMDIVKDRVENPEEAAVNKQLGKEIGDKRDETERGREEALRKLGKDPSKMKLISSKPADVPNDTEGDSDPSSVLRPSAKEDVKDFLTSLVNRLKDPQSSEDLAKLADDVMFIKDYINDEWVDGDDEQMIAEAKSLYFKKTIPEIGRIKDVMGL